ncbi:PhaM family polyhydroxyalkanoate granule multifunctional regulatory protein [Cupriavidus basilensis]
MNLEDLDKRIHDLKAVEGWLQLNTNRAAHHHPGAGSPACHAGRAADLWQCALAGGHAKRHGKRGPHRQRAERCPTAPARGRRSQAGSHGRPI